MNFNKNIKILLEKYQVADIEKNLIWYFLISKNIKYEKSDIINNYFIDFDTNDNLLAEFKRFSINHLKDVENILEMIIPDIDKKINGAFFTPEFIVDFIINELNPEENDRCIDPSCGSGAFLLGLVKYYFFKYNKPIKSILHDNIYGFDILSYNIQRSKILISLFALQQNEVIEERDFNLYHHDSIRYNWAKDFVKNGNKYDIVLGNPPYVKFQDMTQENRDFLKTYYHSINKGSYNLYFAFFELGFSMLKENGKLGYITPNNYFTSFAAESLREFFHTKNCIYRIVDFKDKKIFDAQTYTAITFIQKKSFKYLNYDRITDNCSPVNFLNNVNGSRNFYSKLNNKKWRLLKDKEQENIYNIENVGRQINDLFDISVGIATLKDSIFFLEGKTTTDNKFYLKYYNNNEYYIEKNITKPVYKISDFKNQLELNKNKRKIVFPYKFINNKIQIIPELELKNKYPYTNNYFHDVKSDLEKRDKGKHINPFYSYGRSQGLNKKGIKIVTPSFSRFPRFMLINDEESLFCNGYGLRFKTNQKNMWENENHITDKKNSDVLIRILNSYVMHYYISITSVSIDGGYPCYQKNFIEKFTIPDISEKELFKMRELSVFEFNKYLIELYHLNVSIPNLESYLSSKDGIKVLNESSS